MEFDSNRADAEVEGDLLVEAPDAHVGKAEAIIPLHNGLCAVLDRILKRSTTILTSSKQRPWTADGFRSSFNDAQRAAGVADKDLHFHDLRALLQPLLHCRSLHPRHRGNTGVEQRPSGVDHPRYVGRTAATKEAIRQLNQRREREKINAVNRVSTKIEQKL
jgi:hypothetical protein